MESSNFAPMEISTGGSSTPPSTALECFSKVLHEEHLCDVTFLVGPSREQIRAHKIFLIARSEVWRANFSNNWENPNDHTTIELPQFEPRAFRSFLKFVYTDQVDLEETDWVSLLGLAHFFLVQPLQNICVDIGLRPACSDINKALEAFQTARFYDQKEMTDEIGELMAKSFVELSRTENFQEKVDDETLGYLLGLDHLRVNESQLFKIILSIAEVRARSREDAGNNGTVTVASEMQKFLPLIRIPTMPLNEFRTVVDPSGVLPSEDLVKFNRFFAATDAREKQSIASSWTYSDVERRCRDFFSFYRTTTPASPEIRREIPPEQDGCVLQDHLSFFPFITVWEKPGETPIMPSCGANGVAITGIGIKCPAIFQGATELTTEWASCRIEIQQGDRGEMDRYPNSELCSKFHMTVTVKPNDSTEVVIDPPLALRQDHGNTGLLITAEIKFDGIKNKGRDPVKRVLIQVPQDFRSIQLVDLCRQQVRLANVKNRQTGWGSVNDWQLISGIRVQAVA